MKNATSAATVQFRKQLIAQFKIPETIASNNGTQFVSAGFKDLCRMNSIRHVQTALYYPS